MRIDYYLTTRQIKSVNEIFIPIQYIILLLYLLNNLVVIP